MIGSPFSVLLPMYILAPVASLISVIFNFQVKMSFWDLKLALPLAVELTRGISLFPDSFALYFSFWPKTSKLVSDEERINEVIATLTISKDKNPISTLLVPHRVHVHKPFLAEALNPLYSRKLSVNRHVIGLRHLIIIASYFSNVLNSLIECNTDVSVPCYRNQTAVEQSSYQMALLDVFTTISDLI
jgi:hypothetical protein